MHASRVLKIYFAFVMTISALTGFTSSDQAMIYFANVLEAVDFPQQNQVEAVLAKESAEVAKDIETHLGAEAKIILTNELENAYVEMASESVKMANLELQGFKENEVLKNFKVAIIGVDVNKISQLIIYDGATLIAQVDGENGVYEFLDLDKKMKAVNGKQYQIVLMIKDLHVGERLRMDVLEPVSAKGGYVTIVGKVEKKVAQ